MASVSAIHLAARVAMLDDGRTMPITHLVDAWGDETASEADAVAFVCGADREWWSAALSDFEKVTLQ